MATKMKNKNSEPKKLTLAQARKRVDELEERVKDLENNYMTCYICGKPKRKIYNFYGSTDPIVQSGYAPICKECAEALACRKDKNGDLHEPTKESVQLALSYLNKPFFENVYNASIGESLNQNSGRTKNNVWSSYIKNIAMKQYIGYTYKDSDMFKEKIIYEDEYTPESLLEGRENQDTYVDFVKNKNDVVRLLSYDPFEKEPISDQPFLYSQLLGLLDSSEDANDDMMRVASCISIVRNFLQQQKIDDTIAKLMSDIQQLQKNSATIKSLQDSKAKITGMIKDLAAESCISLKNNKNAKKGENTFSGKLLRLGKLNLRESENNGFDIETCKGMQQVADISMSAIVDKLRMDESEWADMVKEQRIMLDQALEKAHSIEEAFRLVLRENLDLRKELEKSNLLHPSNLLDLEDIINVYVEGGSHGEQE